MACAAPSHPVADGRAASGEQAAREAAGPEQAHELPAAGPFAAEPEANASLASPQETASPCAWPGYRSDECTAYRARLPPDASLGTRVGHAIISHGNRATWSEPDASRAAAESVGGRVHVRCQGTLRGASKWRLKKSIGVGVGYLHRALPTPDAKSVVVLSNQDGILRHYEVATGRLVQSVTLPDFNEFDEADFALLPDAPLRAIVQRPSGSSVVDLATGQSAALTALPGGNGIQSSWRFGLFGLSDRRTEPQSGDLSFVWIPDGLGSQTGGDVSSRVTLGLHLSSSHQRPDHWDLSADGQLLAVDYYPSNQTEFIDLVRNSVVGRIEQQRWGGNIALSKDKKLAAVGGEFLRIYSLDKAVFLTEDKHYGNNIDDIQFTPGDDLLLVSAYDGRVRSYDMCGFDPEHAQLPTPQILAHTGRANVYALGLTEDGRTLVTSSGDKTVKVWIR